MYARVITDQMIAAESTRLGWALVRHSQAQIDEAISHFEDLVQGEHGTLTRTLTKDEQRWISNERKVCALDFLYWLEHYSWIVNWEKKPVHPQLNVAQHLTLDIWADHESRAIAIILLHLKARQLGISTLYELGNCHRFQFWPNSNIIIASADPQKTVEMGQMIKFCLDGQPWWLLPTGPGDTQSRNMTTGFAALNTRIAIESGNKFHGVARGATPNCGHLSELSSWENAEDDVDASFIRAVHETPDVFVGLESTALGRDNWFARTWEIVREDWSRGRSRIRGVFLPWYVGTDIYPPKSDLWRFHQMRSSGWTPNERTIAHAERARQYVVTNPLLFKHLAQGNASWTMPLSQMWFYEIERETALKKKSLNKFLAEMPSDDTEAFQNTGLSVVDQDVILAYRDAVKHPLGVYAITGPGIHASLIPSRAQWDIHRPGAPPIINVSVAGVCRSDEVFQFVPLTFDGYPGYDPTFKLFIYEWPEPNTQYGFGVDTSDGIGEDGSVIEGLRIGDGWKPHAQTCEFASPYIKADQLWPMALALGAFYSVHQDTPNRRVQARICVECRGNGEIVQHELKKRGWFNFHPWKKYDNRKRIPDGKVHKEGVFTNVWFRSMMMDKFLTAVDEEALEIGSPWLVNELASLERDPEEVSARASYGAHDDRVIAMCFPLFSMTVDARPSQRYGRAHHAAYLPYELDQREAVGQSYAVYQPPIAASSTWQGQGIGVRRSPMGRLLLGRWAGTQRLRSGGGW